MKSTRIPFVRLRYMLYVALGFVLACTDEPTVPQDIPAPEFTKVTNTDPTRVLTVGVDAPIHLTLKGTVAGIVVAVDNAIVDLSTATVDCSGQTGPDEPKIGVWLKNNRTHVHIKGGGTGVIKNCGTGVLIGSPFPKSGDPGGSANHIDGLVIENIDYPLGCPGGPYDPSDVTCPVNIALSNSHDNKVDHNRINATEWGIAIVGADPSAVASGRNKVSDNTVVFAQSWAIFVHSDRNTILDNVTMIGTPESPTMGILVDGDHNLVSGNELSGYPTIRLAEGADDNTIKKNVVMGGSSGFVAEGNTFRNKFTKNTALSTSGPNAIDESGACVNNKWTKNTFTTANPSCILGTPVGGDYWTTVAPLATPRSGFAAGVVNGILYLVGGEGPGLQAVASVEAYDPVTNSSTAKAPLLTLRSAHGVGVVNGVLYTVGGSGQNGRVGSVEAYDPVTNSWSTKAPLPTPRAQLAVAVLNGIVYAVGGVDQDNHIVATVEAYDPVTDTWTAKAPLLAPAYNQFASAVNGVLYVGGGASVNTWFGLEAYDPVTNSWTEKAAPPAPPRQHAVAGVVNGVLHMVGGLDGYGNLIATVDAYDPVTNSWTARAPLPTPRWNSGAGVVNGVLYVMGGLDQSNNVLGTVEAYHP